MSKSPDELLAMQFGGASVADNLKRAIESGRVIENDDGSLSPAGAAENKNWARVNNGPPLECIFLGRFLFVDVYARSAVPHGCQACYKVKVSLRTVRQLVAAWGIGKRIQCRSKWGEDLHNLYSQDTYAGYFYTAGLDMARTLFWVVREAIDNDPKLGPDVAMSIKRGCSEFEAAVGPSDKYEFTPEQAELEAYFRTRYRENTEHDGLPPVPLAHWLDVAFRSGDETYLDFTGGQRLRPKMVAYDPGPPRRG
jgi:hypothetical protein